MTAVFTHDPPDGGPLHAPALDGVQIPSGGVLMNGVLHIPGGRGPHPVVVLAHGFPGFERNFDLAHLLRRAGWNVLVFHYRGAWGTGGTFGFQHCLEDLAAAVAWLRDPGNAERHRLDPSRIVLMGHSMGGFAALVTVSRDRNLRQVAALAGANLGYVGRVAGTSEGRDRLVRAFSAGLAPLAGTSGERLVDEARRHAEAWDLVRLAPTLKDRRILLVAGARDTDTPPEQHHQPLVAALAPHAALTTVMLESDHSFSEQRVALARAILAWLGPA